MKLNFIKKEMIFSPKFFFSAYASTKFSNFYKVEGKQFTDACDHSENNSIGTVRSMG